MYSETKYKVETVKNLQKYLRTIAYHDTNLPLVSVDGIYDEKTKIAVNYLQKKHKVSLSDYPDNETWDLIYRLYLDILAKQSEPLTLTAFPSSPYTYSINEHTQANTHVIKLIQVMLNVIQLIYAEPCNIEVSGIYDNATKTETIKFQKFCDISPSGNFDRSTWNCLASYFNKFIQN